MLGLLVALACVHGGLSSSEEDFKNIPPLRSPSSVGLLDAAKQPKDAITWVVDEFRDKAANSMKFQYRIELQHWPAGAQLIAQVDNVLNSRVAFALSDTPSVGEHGISSGGACDWSNWLANNAQCRIVAKQADNIEKSHHIFIEVSTTHEGYEGGPMAFRLSLHYSTPLDTDSSDNDDDNDNDARSARGKSVFAVVAVTLLVTIIVTCAMVAVCRRRLVRSTPSETAETAEAAAMRPLNPTGGDEGDVVLHFAEHREYEDTHDVQDVSEAMLSTWAYAEHPQQPLYPHLQPSAYMAYPYNMAVPSLYVNAPPYVMPHALLQHPVYARPAGPQ